MVPYRVESTNADEKRNPEEALHVASLVVAACEQSEYSEATFGAISLVGMEQARLIETLLRTHMPLPEYDRRRILCGTAPQFQGDERDVIFLSMVDFAPQKPPLPLRGEGAHEMYKKTIQRCSQSRARSAFGSFTSLDPSRDLKPGDLRYRLIEFARDPAGLQSKLEQSVARAESPLEIGVIKSLTSAGFRVTPQFAVGGYRIDIVVGNEGKRLAIECDGDRYHTQDNLQQDLERQAQLERMGWRFLRIRGSAYFRNPDSTMNAVFSRLSELGIEPEPSESVPNVRQQGDELSERVRIRAAEIRQAWRPSAANRQQADRMDIPPLRPEPESPKSHEPQSAAPIDAVGQLEPQPFQPAALLVGVPAATSSPQFEFGVGAEGAGGPPLLPSMSFTLRTPIAPSSGQLAAQTASGTRATVPQ